MGERAISAPLPLRLALSSLAIFGLAFGVVDYPNALRRQAMRTTYRQLVAGETLPGAFLKRRAAAAQERSGADACDGRDMLAFALIEAKLAEDALTTGANLVFGDRLTNAKARVERQILCSPSDGFAWFVAFWIEVMDGDLGERAWRYLDRSYRFAPREDWVALIRLPLVARLASAIPEDRLPFVLDDFEMLARHGYVAQCARLYALTPPPLRDALAARLNTLEEARKQAFNYYLRPYPVDPIMTLGDVRLIEKIPIVPFPR